MNSGQPISIRQKGAIHESQNDCYIAKRSVRACTNAYDADEQAVLRSKGGYLRTAIDQPRVLKRFFHCTALLLENGSVEGTPGKLGSFASLIAHHVNS